VVPHSGKDDPKLGPDRAKASVRDRRGRGARGPAFGATPLAPQGVPRALTRAQRFDIDALSVFASIEHRWPGQLDHIDLAVEEVPTLPPNWSGDSMPLSTLQPLPGARARLVVFRQPLVFRAPERGDLTAVLLRVLCNELAPVLGTAPANVHPDYR